MAQVRRSQIAIAELRVEDTLTRTKMLDRKVMEVKITPELARLLPESIRHVSDLLREGLDLEKNEAAAVKQPLAH